MHTLTGVLSLLAIGIYCLLGAGAVPEAAEPLPLDNANKCHYRIKDFEGYTFRPTTKSSAREVVYQAYDELNCVALNRYLYRWKNGDQHQWIIDYVLFHSASDPIAYIKGDWTGCDTNDRRATFPAEHKESTLTNWKGPPCSAPVPAKGLRVDNSNSCRFKLSGYEAYTFQPSKRKRGGEPVYQAVDDETCQPLNRYLYRWYNKNYSTYEWNIDNDTTESAHSANGGRLGFVTPDFRGCFGNSHRTVRFWIDGAHVANSVLKGYSGPTECKSTTTTTTITTTAVTNAAVTDNQSVPLSVDPSDPVTHESVTPTGVIIGAAAGGVAVLAAGAYGGMKIYNRTPVIEFDVEAELATMEEMNRDAVTHLYLDHYV